MTDTEMSPEESILRDHMQRMRELQEKDTRCLAAIGAANIELILLSSANQLAVKRAAEVIDKNKIKQLTNAVQGITDGPVTN